MSDTHNQLARSRRTPSARQDLDSRLLPLAVAGVCCFLTAVATGTLLWYFIWLPYERASAAPAPEQAQVSIPEAETPTAEPEPPSAAAEPAVEQRPLPEPPQGSVYVPGGEIALYGGEGKPIERFILEGFAISETEVTNGEYSEFLRETGHAPPPGWNGPNFPDGTANFPVVNVTWRDATEFCRWKSGKIGLPVRLPSEAEWELAARGPERRKYPWGDEWDPDAAMSKETGGKVSAVKSFVANRSGSGAFDMVGNVWEWVGDEIGENETVSDDQAEAARQQGRKLRIVKGGSAEEPSKDLHAQARYEVPENTKVKVIGFRYVVSWKKPS